MFLKRGKIAVLEILLYLKRENICFVMNSFILILLFLYLLLIHATQNCLKPVEDYDQYLYSLPAKSLLFLHLE